jgi:hypothetical protein
VDSVYDRIKLQATTEIYIEQYFIVKKMDNEYLL